MAEFMRSLGVTRVTELNWWESTKVVVEVGGRKVTLEVHAVPAMHWSARSPVDTNQSLWCSFVVKGEKDSFFHWCVPLLNVRRWELIGLCCSGDTGYFAEGFKAIGRALGPFSLVRLSLRSFGASLTLFVPQASLPIGAYSPRWRTFIHLSLSLRR